MSDNAAAISTLEKDRRSLLARLTAIERLSEFLGMAPEQEAEGLPLLTRQVESLECDLERHAAILPHAAGHRHLEKNCNQLDRALGGFVHSDGASHRRRALNIIERIRDLSGLVRDHLETELKRLFPQKK